MIARRESNRVVFMGENAMDVAAWIARTPANWGHASSRKPPQYAWDLDAGWQGALAMARDGWHDGALDLYKSLNAVIAPTTGHAKLTRDVAGHYPDVPAYLSGDPCNMITRGKAKGIMPVIHIMVNTCASWGVKANCYMNFGIALCAIVDKLEAAGRRVELDVVWRDRFRAGNLLLMGWNIKRGGDALDMGAVAFGIAHPAAFRRLGFAMIERTNASQEEKSYGTCLEPLDASDAAHLGDETAFLINAYNNKLNACDTVASAIAFTARMLNKAAGETIVEIDQ